MSPISYPASHPAVVTVAKRVPLEVMSFPTVEPAADEILVRMTHVGMSPLDLHQADSGLLVQHPLILGGSFSAVVVAVGADAAKEQYPLTPGDKVQGFAWMGNTVKALQTYATLPAYLVGRTPGDLSPEAAAAIPSSLVTAFHTITKDLGLELPWPRPQGWISKQQDKPILIWGAASTCGTFLIQVLKHWGYKKVLAVASGKHHEELRKQGAAECFDYRNEDVTERIQRVAPHIPYIVDCIGQVEGTLRPLSKVSGAGTVVAVLLPVIIRDATEEEEPIYGMDPKEVLVGEWKDGVRLSGVRTHFYLENQLFKIHLQREIIPELLEQGVIQPVPYRLVEGKTLLERAQNALTLLRARAVSGEKLVVSIQD